MSRPRGQRDPSIDRTSEYESFIQELEEYHEKRGTTFESEPRVGNRHVDLLRLYNIVVERGGYDAVSAEKLAWRKLAQDFNLGSANLPTLAFGLKTVYYRNLAAYEIQKVHGKEPPPKEILEEVTAAGGDLLNRTVESYNATRRNLPDTDEGSDTEQQTPKEEKMDLDEPASGGRATRSLRQAPPQRVLFQPEMASSRQTRHSSGTASSPQPQNSSIPYNNSASNPNSASFNIDRYEPKTQMPLTLRSVATPGNNRVLFEKLRKDRIAQRTGIVEPTKPIGIPVPGTGFFGPNIYLRNLKALQSGIFEEQRYALHHFVKYSCVQGHKYKFSEFPGVAEALVDKILEVSRLFYGVEWEINYEDDIMINGPFVLSGIYGTKDILQKIESFQIQSLSDGMETEEFIQQLSLITEASLVIRNLVMSEDNAEYLSKFALIRDAICIILSLPCIDQVVELRHNALEIAEQLTMYFSLDSEDPLYVSLLYQLTTADRGIILTTLRAISRISMNLEETCRIRDVPVEIVRKIIDYTILDDEELVGTCLDFLYQYSASLENVELMLEAIDVTGLVNNLVRLLSYGAKEIEVKTITKQAVEETPATEIPDAPRDLFEELHHVEEPQRSSKWLRCCFEENPNGEVTQIHLWQAYQRCFLDAGRLLPAAEFIKNVSQTITTANAQVIHGPVAKFIIKGISPRKVPCDTSGRPYHACHWRVNASQCSVFVSTAEKMFHHILQTHCDMTRGEDGKYELKSAGHVYKCFWGSCKKLSVSGTESPAEFASHIRMHLPDDSAKSRPSNSHPAEYRRIMYIVTQTDERGDAAGLPLTSALVLRNLARNLPRGPIDEKGDEQDTWTSRIFTPLKPELFHIMTYNRVLAPYLIDLTNIIGAGGG